MAAAISFIDEFGLPGLSMRRLGAMLGVEAMSLYRYVPGRENLLDAVVGSILDEMAVDAEVLDSPRDGWQDFLQRLAHGVRRVALAHPRAFPLVASRPTEAPWLRPPLRSLDTVESFLHGLVEEGFTDDAAVAAYRAFTSFLLGHLLLEVSTYGADVGPLDVIDDAEPTQRTPAGPPHRRTAQRGTRRGPCRRRVRGGAGGPPRPDRADERRRVHVVGERARGGSPSGTALPERDCFDPVGVGNLRTRSGTPTAPRTPLPLQGVMSWR